MALSRIGVMLSLRNPMRTLPPFEGMARCPLCEACVPPDWRHFLLDKCCRGGEPTARGARAGSLADAGLLHLLARRWYSRSIVSLRCSEALAYSAGAHVSRRTQPAARCGES